MKIQHHSSETEALTEIWDKFRHLSQLKHFGSRTRDSLNINGWFHSTWVVVFLSLSPSLSSVFFLITMQSPGWLLALGLSSQPLTTPASSWHPQFLFPPFLAKLPCTKINNLQNLVHISSTVKVKKKKITLESLVSVQNSSCNTCLCVASAGGHLMFTLQGKNREKEGKNLYHIPNRKRSNIERRNESNVRCFRVRKMAQVICVYITVQINGVLVHILRQ